MFAQYLLTPGEHNVLIGIDDDEDVEDDDEEEIATVVIEFCELEVESPNPVG